MLPFHAVNHAMASMDVESTKQDYFIILLSLPCPTPPVLYRTALHRPCCCCRDDELMTDGNRALHL